MCRMTLGASIAAWFKKVALFEHHNFIQYKLVAPAKIISTNAEVKYNYAFPEQMEVEPL